MTKLKTMILIVSLIMSPFAMASNESLELPIDLFKPTDWPDGIYLVFWEEIGDFFVATVETTHPTKEDLAKNNAVYSSAAEHQRLFVSLLGEQAVSEEEILSTESITAKVVSASGIRTATDEETKILLWIARRCGQYQPEVGYSDCKLLDEEQSTSPVFRSYWGQMPLVSENDRRRSRDMWQNLRARERYLRAKERNAAFSKRWKLPAFVILVLIVSLSHILALRGRKTTNDRSLNPPVNHFWRGWLAKTAGAVFIVQFLWMLVIPSTTTQIVEKSEESFGSSTNQTSNGSGWYKLACLLAQTPGHEKKSEELLSKAAYAGYPMAQWQYGLLLANEHDHKKEGEAFLRSAAQSGLAAGQYDYALFLLNNDQTRLAEAIDWLIAAAAQIPAAKYSLGCCYFQGIGVDKDLKKAEECFRQAGDNGCADAWYDLACLLQQRTGENAESLECLRKAAIAGVPPAQFYYGSEILYKANHDEKSIEEGMNFIYQSALAGFESARINLAMNAERGDFHAQYYYGKLLASDSNHQSEALSWFRKAAKAGHKKAEIEIINSESRQE